MKKQSLIAAAIACLAATTAFAQEVATQSPSLDTSAFKNVMIYGAGGSEGYGLGVGKHINEKFTIRAEYLGWSADDVYTQNSIEYKVNLNLRGGGVFADFRPFEGNFRMVGGVTMRGSSAGLSGSASNGVFTIDGVDYPAAGESIAGKIKFPSTMPYLGIGWGYNGYNKKGLSMGVDLGASFGKAKGELVFSQGLVNAAGATAIAAEQKKFNDEVNKLKFFPVVKVGVSYTF